ncbi:chromosome segregation ATPase [Fischerella thermalis]|uniref:chromosome segregation ATPase n=1 Tax=Fischerella thermalis TaxID=372787 RepID=UPI000C8094D9|nr:chromosome segregation ATPase [Fischerella thermalis]MBF1990358.1 chromosome segregation ATPase [Fischerella thermalis M58_A2018_009]MBF2061429.1 chromosome segregation ATPase [Fischerella thermalis M66_A2018_004]MBF2070702.1 chromosome segregation ATPase [Fischerella thermalis M48_A2018_028]PLZ86501.1 chromosome segregation ATPase [Fischerella thermalis CCMEE 5194]
MTERDTSESWSLGRAREPDMMTRLSRAGHANETKMSGIPPAGSNSKSVMQSKPNTSEQLPPSGHGSGKMPRWLKSWVLWALLFTLVPGGIAFMAMGMLLKLPSAPNCPSIFWPLASASVRLHCAQLAASKQTVKDLLQAIDLVKLLPESHPLRGEIDRYLEQWSRDILKLADESFQQGKLEEAIATAKQIPEDLPAHQLVKEQISTWEKIWLEAEGIYQQAENEMREQHWHDAFMAAAKLLRVNNKYWASIKYDQLNRLITSAREDGDKLAKAENLAESGNVDNLLKAIKIAESIQKDSYVYPKAQEAIPKFGRAMLDLAQKNLDRRDADQAISIAQQIPLSTGLQSETEDFIAIAEAQRNAWIGTVAALETAIAQAQQIDPSRAVYDKAQQLIARWQLEIEDVSKLEKARTLASQGTINDLTAAIAQAQQIPNSNPRAEEAREEINGWVAQVQTIEDRPYLERAEEIALLEDINSLQAAITEARQIRRGRALYREAQRKIALWTAKIQRIEDQPLLDQARDLASSGNLPAAINVAQQIPSGRALSGEAQAAIDDWRAQIRARENWSKAKEVALAGTPQALVEAIRLASRVPRSSILSSDASIAIDQWSQQLLDIARSQGESDIPRAIKTARLIPRYAAAYNAAQEQIRVWRNFLNPEPEQQFDPLLPGRIQQ